MQNLNAVNRDDEIASLLDVEGELMLFMRKLNADGEYTFKTANNTFTDLHAHAAWTDIAPLATLADKIWNELEAGDQNANMPTDARASLSKHLFTYKFLLNRMMNDYQNEIAAAMAS